MKSMGEKIAKQSQRPQKAPVACNATSHYIANAACPNGAFKIDFVKLKKPMGDKIAQQSQRP